MPKPCHQCGKRESKKGYLFCERCLPAVKNRVSWWAKMQNLPVRRYYDSPDREKDNRLYREDMDGS